MSVDRGTSTAVAPSWIPEGSQSAYNDLKTSLPALCSTADLDNATVWSEFMKDATAEKNFPDHLITKLTPFQQLLLVKALRADRAISAAVHFLTNIIGASDLSPPTLKMEALSKESKANVPLLFMLSQGVDVSQDLQELAASTVGESNFFEVAMGQGQEDEAIAKLKSSAESGTWLCLQNLHLVTEWLPELEKALSGLQPHENFRLWLTTEAHNKFPSVLLETCLKITIEAPPGTRRNIERIYSLWENQDVKMKSVLHGQCSFVLAWVHAILQERRSFIPQAWSKFYEFNQSDVNVSRNVIADATDSNQINWQLIRGLLQSAIYGGRIDNEYDMRILRAYLQQYFNDAIVAANGNPKRKLYGDISIPKSQGLQEYYGVIKSLPDTDDPKIFGLPKNIMSSWERSQFNYLTTQLGHLSRPLYEAVGFDRERWSNDLSNVFSTWKRLNQGSQLHTMHMTELDVSEADDPIKLFLKLERYNAICLVQYVHKTLSSLSKAVKGTSALSNDAREAGLDLLKSKTPQKWFTAWNGPENAFDFMASLMRKAIAVDRMCKDTDATSVTRSTIDISDFFRPGTFMNALRQHTASVTGASIDKLNLTTSWINKSIDSPVQVEITGLQIESGTFDGSALRENSHVSPTVAAVPVVKMGWTLQPPSSRSNSVWLPVYVDSSREEAFLTVEIPCTEDPEHWVIMGTAMFVKG